MTIRMRPWHISQAIQDRRELSFGGMETCHGQNRRVRRKITVSMPFVYHKSKVNYPACLFNWYSIVYSLTNDCTIISNTITTNNMLLYLWKRGHPVVLHVQ